MVRALLRLSLKLGMGAAVLYGVFFAKLGGFTLYEHGARIAATRECQELRSGMHETLDEVTGLLSDGMRRADPDVPAQQAAR